MIVKDLLEAMRLTETAHREWCRIQPDGFSLDEDRANEAAEAYEELETALEAVLCILCSNRKQVA